MIRPAELTLCELGDPGVPGLESYSPFCLKAHRALKHAGLAYTRRHGEMPSSFRALNPTGQVPVLLVSDEPVRDSTAILARIERLSGVELAPADPRGRAEAWLWEDFADVSLNGYLVAARWADARNWPSVRAAYFGAMPALLRAFLPGRLRANVIAALVARDVWRAGADACWSRFTATLDQLEARAPKKRFWLGDEVSVAALGIFAQLHSLRTPLTAWQRERIAERTALSNYLDRVDAATTAVRAAAPAQNREQGRGDHIRTEQPVPVDTGGEEHSMSRQTASSARSAH